MEHCFNVGIAKKYGVNAAILLNNLLSITDPEPEVKDYYNYAVRLTDGEVWAKISMAEFIKIMPYMSEKKIRKAVKLLSENGLILVHRLSADEFDNTNWYAITKKGLELIIKNREEMRS